MRTIAVKDGDYWVINGAKNFIDLKPRTHLLDAESLLPEGESLQFGTGASPRPSGTGAPRWSTCLFGDGTSGHWRTIDVGRR